MSELEDKISSLLSSPEDMEKLTRIAKSIMSGTDLGSAPDSGSVADSGSAPDSGKTPPAAAPASGSVPSGGDSLLGGLDPGMLATMGKFMSKAGSGGEKQALLRAMQPYLSEKRRDKLARAMQLAKMAKLAGTAFSEFGGDKG